MRVTVVPWNPQWSIEFESIRRELSNACASTPVRAIEHVGSTSVPGLAAKPIIDVAVVVARDDVDDAIAALEAAGYSYQGERGVPDRHAFHAPPHGPARHVYVAVDASLALRNHLAVRDVLRSDPELRRRYGELKLDLASRDIADSDA
ncbi:MAG: GrpB family protein, partial [Actinobacteria bacterium]|nr:GrpB family protein [Actinomycetota bacterium]